MGNITGNTKKNTKCYNRYYTSITDNEIKDIRLSYNVIDVDWLDADLVNSEMFNSGYFQKYPNKKEVINNMLEYYLNDKDKEIYKQTDYLCNREKKVCICNKNAENLRKIYDKTYNPNVKYISWCN